MNRVYFVRHAEPNYENHDDTLRELTPKGWNDRKKVTEFFSDKEIQVALSSPFKRSIDTIKDFTDTAGLEIEIIDAFRERKIDNVWIADFSAFAKQQWNDFSFKLSDGECLREVQERNINALQAVLQKHPGRNIIIGSHGTALSTVIHYYNPSFGYADFERIKAKMPWIVEFNFDDNLQMCSITEHDL